MPDRPRRQSVPALGPRSVVLAVCVSLALAGCTSLWGGKSPQDGEKAGLTELMKVPPPPELIREAAIPHGMQKIQVDGIGAVNRLPGTGGPADPSPYREQLLEEMKRHDVAEPNLFLEMDSTALVRVRATIPPGARRGDPIDVRVIAPRESRASDLHGGWLLDTRMRQQMVLRKAAMLESSVRQSEVLVIGTGPVLARADYSPGEDSALKLEGNVISGGRVQESRKLGLVLRPEFQHVKMASAVASAINRRFFFFDGTTRRGIGKAVEDDFIEFDVHPRYRDNVSRMMAVIRAIGMAPESSNTQRRLADLAERLGAPETAADAALQLEALGESAVPTLLEGIESKNPELRFYAAEALAYLDRSESVKPLEEAARDVAAFRHPALLALQGIKQQVAVDALRRLMNEPSLETRYGAFVSIRRRGEARQSLGGRAIGSFWLYEVPSEASAAVVASLRESPEIVLFGSPGRLQIPQYLMGPSGIMVRTDPAGSDRLHLSRFQVGQEDKRASVDNHVAALVQGVADVGGGYGDVIALLRMAKEKGFLQDQLAIDPLPRPMRTYYRDQGMDEDEDDEQDDDPDGSQF